MRRSRTSSRSSAVGSSMLPSLDFLRHTSAYVSIRHSIRQHTSAYVSRSSGVAPSMLPSLDFLRHTSACVSIRHSIR
jgi:hypothetical protein